MSKVIELAKNQSEINCTIDLTGSKSFTNRALILAAQAEGETVLVNASQSDDSKVLIEGLKKFAVNIESHANNLKISKPAEYTPYKGVIDVGPAGTSMRFLTAFAAGVHGSEVELRGSERMHERPVSDLVDALKQAGIEIEYLNTDGCPPLKIKGLRKQISCHFDLSCEISSQFLTALLLAAPSLASYLEVSVEGQVVSSSYIDMTLDLLKQFGVNVINKGYSYYLIAKTEPQSGMYVIDGDASGACYFWTLAALSAGKIKVNNINYKGSQGDLKYLEVLQSLGCNITASGEDSDHWICVEGSSEIFAIEADMSLMPDSAPTLAVLCAFANGTSKLTGLSTLKHKETDRLQAIKNELKKINIECEVGEDSIVIHGGKAEAPKEAIDTYQDHRIAMSFALLAARLDNVKIKDSEVVNKSFPDFWERLKDCGIGVK